MSKIGFKVLTIWRSKLADSEDHNFPPLIPLSLAIDASIINGIKDKSEDAESTESFLEERTVEGIQNYNKATNGIVLRTLSDDLMLAISRKRTDWIKIKQGLKDVKNFRIYVNIQKFGVIVITVVAKMFNIGSNGTLTHRLCCDISSRLIRESVRPYPVRPYSFYEHRGDYYKLLQTRFDRKISALDGELPKTLQDQLLSTMQWMFWNDALV